ncbi:MULTISPECIES: MFS transporter [unclassified Ensifer]|uniref:MFS transporter n=1 Tax=unclassified Ensifer TaxID=2633371 RepID=UPI00070ED2AB|nr:MULTISPECIES: MFS transporter [unclassified Ensifer]KQW56741.1 MFS transporter [Ensifer sp. Root127]KQW60371.1 MFS transporter [Ensifer sp. Root1252]KQY57834.1 MFS transporter [Ensifer sp. Root142]KRC77666.1 MFS transporter [Ensifer sp. Root231]KRC99510.1 MFS transporter [Ensifer sp. Root258]
MTSSLFSAMRNPSIRVSMLAIFLFGFAGAATSPYQSVVGINELGLSDGLYSLLILAAATVNVIVSVSIGILADRIGNYRVLMSNAILFGVVGYGIVYVLPYQSSFLVSVLLFLPIYGAVYTLLFANVRSVARRMSGQDAGALTTGARAAISLAWVLVPGLVGFALAGGDSMLPAYLLASLGCSANLLLVFFSLPNERGVDPGLGKRLSYWTSFGEILAPRIFARVVAVAMITSTLHINAAVLPLIMTNAVGGSVTDIGIIAGVVAFLEVVFIFVWARIQVSLLPAKALALGTVIYIGYMVLLGLSSAPWHIYALTLISAFGAAALITIPITYLQELIADRPGLGSSLISVNIFMSGGLCAALFALGTRISDYSGTALLGGLGGLAGLGLLLLLEGGNRKATTP